MILVVSSFLLLRHLNFINSDGQKIRVTLNAAHTVIANLIRVQVAHVALTTFNALSIIQNAAFHFLHCKHLLMP